MKFRLNLEKFTFKLTKNLTSKLQLDGFLFSGRLVSSCLWWRSYHCLCLVLWTFYLFYLKALRQTRFWPNIRTSYFFYSNLYLHFLRPCYENVFVKNLYVFFQRKLGNKSHNLSYCSSLQPRVVYNFSEIEITFLASFLTLRGRLLMAPWHGLHLFDKE